MNPNQESQAIGQTRFQGMVRSHPAAHFRPYFAPSQVVSNDQFGAMLYRAPQRMTVAHGHFTGGLLYSSEHVQ